MDWPSWPRPPPSKGRPAGRPCLFWDPFELDVMGPIDTASVVSGGDGGFAPI